MKDKAIAKLKEEFKTTSNMGKVIINHCLLPHLKQNEIFAERILREDKKINECTRYIGIWVSQSDNKTLTHDSIFSAALHFYDEDKPEYVEEFFQEEEMKFGDIIKEFNTPIIKHITGTIVRETIKEVIREVEKLGTKESKKDVAKKVTKVIEDGKQMNMFDMI